MQMRGGVGANGARSPSLFFLMYVCGEGGVVFLFLGGGGWVCGAFVLIL